MVARKCLIVTLYVYCLSSFLSQLRFFPQLSASVFLLYSIFPLFKDVTYDTRRITSMLQLFKFYNYVEILKRTINVQWIENVCVLFLTINLLHAF